MLFSKLSKHSTPNLAPAPTPAQPMDLYAAHILEHFRNPMGKTQISKDKFQIVHEEKNPSCGDEITLGLVIEDDRIIEMKWDGIGCAISQAAFSMIVEEFGEAQIEEIEKLDAETMYQILGVPIGTRRVKCALLGLHTLKNALHKWKGEEVQDWNETIKN